MPKGHAPFSVVNRVVNPGLRLFLKGPLHHPLSGNTALITVTGRKTGRVFTIPVAYRREGDLVTIEVGWPERKRWWRNLTGPGAPVTIRLRGTDHTGHAVAHGDELEGVAVEVRLDQASRQPPAA
jgi:hypothetical protein